MIKRISWTGMALFALIIGLYPLLYFFLERKFGLLSTKSEEVLHSYSWNTGFYTHIILGGLALFIGWMQFSPGFRSRNLKLHRAIGKTYVVSALLSSLSGLYIGFYATGGILTSLGFISLAVVWLCTTWMGLCDDKKRAGGATSKDDDIQLCRLFFCCYPTNMASNIDYAFGKLWNRLRHCGLAVLDTQPACCASNGEEACSSKNTVDHAITHLQSCLNGVSFVERVSQKP